MTHPRRRHNFYKKSTGLQRTNYLTEEQKEQIKFDPDEFERLNLKPESLENFIILDSSGYDSFFFECQILENIVFYCPSEYSIYTDKKYIIGSAYVPFQFGKGPVTNIAVYIQTHAKYNVLSVRKLEEAKMLIDLKNFTIRNRWNKVVSKIYSIGTQLCILASNAYRYMYIHPVENFNGPLNKIRLHRLFGHMDVLVIKKMINDRIIRGFELDKKETWDDQERVYCKTRQKSIDKFVHCDYPPFRDMHVQIIEDLGMISHYLFRTENGIKRRIELSRRVIIFTCCNTGYRFLFNLLDSTNQISQINRCFQLVIDQIYNRMPRNKIEVIRIPVKDEYLNLENDSLIKFLSSHGIIAIIHKPNDHDYPYDSIFWGIVERNRYTRIESDNFLYIDTDNKKFVKNAGKLLLRYGLPEVLWYYCLKNIIETRKRDINLAITPRSQVAIENFGSVINITGYEPNDVIYLGVIMNTTNHIIWIKSEKVIKIGTLKRKNIRRQIEPKEQ